MRDRNKFIYNLKYIFRALRLPFVTVSVLPFILGSFLAKEVFNISYFLLGLIAVLSTHLSANLINDYADSKSGADWQDRRFYKFFGGSKLIQENILSEKFYYNAAMFFVCVAGCSIVVLAALLKSLSIIGFYILILFLALSYSQRPLRLSYHRLGEIVIFILFGPALVMGGYFIQTKIFPTFEGFMLSLPFGLLTTAVLFANEIPDYLDDKRAGKSTWVDFLGPQKSFLLYYLLMFLAFLSVVINIGLGYLGYLSVVVFICMMPVFKAANTLKKNSDNKIRLVESSKLTIAVHTFVNIILILDILL